MTEPSGILIINKHADATSHDIVNRIRRLYNTKRVGHTGTLDPDATGVLVVLVGRAAKAAEYLVSDTKKYRATLRLGLTTDTEDASGETLTVCDKLPSEKEVMDICQSFVGKIKQIPPMYSALKKDGQKLCDLARKGIVIEREAREVTIFELTCSPTDTPSDYTLDVYCSSGTYIRTLCADIGKALGCGGIMATLQRTYAGGYSIENSVTVKELEEMTEEERFACLLPTESLFDTLQKVNLSDFYEKLCRNGCQIYQKKINTSIKVGQRVRIADKNGNFFALGEIKEYEEGTAIKAIKFFDIK